MIKRAFLGIIAAVVVFGTTYQPDTQKIYGIVLNEDGDGIVVNPESMEPVDDYYNYISYKGIDAAPGDIIITEEIINEDGEVEKRISDRKAGNVTQKQLHQYRQQGHENNKED
jgi:hypothetical protein